MYSVTEQFIAWLGALGYDAYANVPADPPTEFVTVERVGGYVEDMVDHASVAVQAWAATDERAEELANGIRNELLLEARPAGVHHIAIDSGPYRFYDEETRCPRYQIALDVTCQLTD